MKTPSRNVLIATSAVALLLAAGGAGLKIRRQNTIKTLHFTASYAAVIQQLEFNIDSCRGKMVHNAVTVPDIMVAASTPVTVQPVFAKERSIVLQGISWSRDRPVVMVEDRIYKTGDRIGETTIQEIRSRSVILRTASGELRELTLIREDTP